MMREWRSHYFPPALDSKMELKADFITHLGLKLKQVRQTGNVFDAELGNHHDSDGRRNIERAGCLKPCSTLEKRRSNLPIRHGVGPQLPATCS
jgi:hypothetical protein